MWGYPANIPPSSLLHRKSLAKVKFLIYTEFASNLSFRLFRAGKKSPFFGTLSSISYQFVLGKSVGTKWLKILRGLNFVPVRFRSAAVDRSERDVDAAFLLFFCSKKQLKIWLSAKTLYLSAHSRIEILQITTILLPLNEPWYVRNPRYAKIWYSTSVLNRWKIEYRK